MEYISDESLRRGYRTAVVIGCAMIFSVLVYAGIVEYLCQSKAPFAGFAPVTPDVFGTLRLVLLGGCLLDFALIPFLRNRVLSAQIQGGAQAAGPLPALVGRLIAASMISFALCESIAIYGLVLFLMNGARSEFYLFLGLSFVALAIHFPRLERWQEWARKSGDTIG